MEIDIKGNLKIRCSCCNKIYNIESEFFVEDITYEKGGMPQQRDMNHLRVS